MSAAADPVYNLEQLECWPACLDHWPADGRALAVIGSPIGHSLSPAMHNAALAAMAREHPAFGSWRYFKFEIAPDELDAALAEFRLQGFVGLNLTIPHKALAAAHLKKRDWFVLEAGAANTLKALPDGDPDRWEGFNTDGEGLRRALDRDLRIGLHQADVILLGTGGAARAAAVECCRNASKSLAIGFRSETSLETFLQSLSPNVRQHISATFDLRSPEKGELPGDAVVINATSLGLKETDSSPIDLRRIPSPSGVFDMIYRPSQTALLRQAESLGLNWANGLSMLVYQGARSLELWTGASVPAEVMHAAAHAALAAA